MRSPLFKEIVEKSTYLCHAVAKDGSKVDIKWVNSNKLLGQGFCGVKTGVTATAGPCLCSAYEHKSATAGPVVFVVVILASKSMETRWGEVLRLTRWAIARFEEDYGRLGQQ